MIDRVSLTRIIRDTISDIASKPYIKTGVSNRHIHLSVEDADILFGTGYQLTPIKDLLPGQYACKETLRISGPKGKFDTVRILGPLRSETQFELSLTDTFTLGIKAPVNESGNLSGAAKVKIENSASGASVEKDCAIVALRHVHLCPRTAGTFGLRDKQMVALEYGAPRHIVFHDVRLRVSSAFTDEAHLDTDEANAGGIRNDDFGLIIF
jgi:putative phosphotransacetylase